MSQKKNSGAFDRRDFLKLGAAATVAAVAVKCSNKAPLTEPAVDFIAPAIEQVRIGYIGVGNQGSSHVRNLARIPGCKVVAVADLKQNYLERAAKICTDAGHKKPELYSDPEDYKRICDRDDIDLIYTATPWELHTPVMVAAMEGGKHAATEIPAAVTLEECWQLVETSERTQRYAIMMENCCYDRVEMMVLNMARKGLFGDVLHAQCAYRHDLRANKLVAGTYVNDWRIQHSFDRNGNLYPMHGLGPVAQVMNVNRGDQFDYMTSMSSKSAGLNLYAAEHLGEEHPLATREYALGDINVSMIHTKLGRTIVVYHDCSAPRPYSRDYLIQGTKGIMRKYPESRIHIEGRSKAHTWEDFDDYRQEFEHPLWTAKAEEALGAGHGGMDYIEDSRLIQCLREGKRQDMDVYDAASWSAVSELSEISVADRSNSVDFPDFTRGSWKTREPLGIIGA
jgi:predicted dehydrogenase